MKLNNKRHGTVLKSLLAAWITIVFGTSILIAAFSPLATEIYNSNPVINFLLNVWEIADQMGPAVKISLIFLFATLFYSTQKFTVKGSKGTAYVSHIIFSFIAVFLVLALLPEQYSRGYGIGLTGARFDKAMIPYYFMGALLEGTVFTYTYYKLSA